MALLDQSEARLEPIASEPVTTEGVGLRKPADSNGVGVLAQVNE